MNSLKKAFVPNLSLLLIISAFNNGLAQGAIQSPFDGAYVLIDLGSLPELPASYGGLTFLFSDPNTILIGGSANNALGKLYSIGVVRDGDQHITGFSGTATVFVDAAFNDGGVCYGPGNVLFMARYPSNAIGQTKPGSAIVDKIVELGPLGVAPSPGGLNFVPAGFPGAGQLKSVSWSGGQWYTLSIAPDETGTYDVTGATLETTISGGPEGLVYVPAGSPVFEDLGLELLVSEWSAGNVVAYDIDSDGDPLPESRRVFISGLNGAEGAEIDPLTGDFLFSTFGGGDRVVVVRGFNAPIPVELSSFAVHALDNKVVLNWTTQTEINNFGFDIERSEDNIEFRQIGFVEGNGTTTLPQQYTFVDENLQPGGYNYRLKQIDLDGDFEYSDVIEITFTPPKEVSLLQNYPNPFNPETVIRFEVPEATTVALRIFNLRGQEIATLVNAKLEAGFHRATWDGKDTKGTPVSGGLYLYELKAGNATLVKKMMLLR